MRTMQLIYASRPFGYDDLTLASILLQARDNNARNGITGCLICREDLFLQMLEGPRDLVTSTFSRIPARGASADLRGGGDDRLRLHGPGPRSRR
jgi:Sensors of blue-light using FAD